MQSQAMKSQPMQNEKQLILDLLDAFTKSLHDKDAKAMAACYAEDAIGYEQAAPLAISSATLHDPAFFQEWFDTWEGPIDSTPHNPTLKISGDLAICYALINMKGKKNNGPQIDFWFRSTMGLTKESGEWKILHTHSSVPFAMDGSYKALVDLKPED